MKTEISIQGEDFYINGRPTYEARQWNGRRIEGLLLNSRMVQAVFDDECRETASLWKYPDTGTWDPERNTAEFCEMLPEYRKHGLLAVTVGLQGGGSVYTPAVYDRYRMSAYDTEGKLKERYFSRLLKILSAADECGMAVIVNYFYWKQSKGMSMRNFRDITAAVTERLLATGYRNILVDIANEVQCFRPLGVLSQDNVHELIDAAVNVTYEGRKLPVSSSSGGGKLTSSGRWAEMEDFSMPHGNGQKPAELAAKIRKFRETGEYRKRPRPVIVNEDSVFTENLDAAVSEHAS